MNDLPFLRHIEGHTVKRHRQCLGHSFSKCFHYFLRGTSRTVINRPNSLDIHGTSHSLFMNSLLRNTVENTAHFSKRTPKNGQ